MKKENIILYFMLILILVFNLTACVSQTNCIKESDFCGLIVDENNRPISNFKVYCYKNPLYKISAITNNSGIFMFPSLKTGNYFVSGEKENYVILQEKEINFLGNSTFFCGQVMGMKGALEKVDNLIERKEFVKGGEILSKIFVKENTWENDLLLGYKALINYFLGNNEVYTESIKKLRKNQNKQIELFVTEMEKNLYEK